MIKKNNEKGFIAITVIYSFFILFIMVLLVIMYSYISDRKTANRIKTDIVNEFNTDIPQISINPKGSDEKSSSYSITVKVNNPSSLSSVKYVWSTTQTGTPTTDIPVGSVGTGATITSPSAAGNYYLIIKACNTSSNCQTLISNRFVVGS